MNVEIKTLGPKPEWIDLKKDLVKERFPDFSLQYKNLCFYDLVEVYVDEEGSPLLMQANDSEVPSYLAFTRAELLSRAQRARPYPQIQENPPQAMLDHKKYLKKFMLGDLATGFCDEQKNRSVKINPILVEDAGQTRYVAEEIIIIPAFDPVTKKYLICDPQEALALLAIQQEDQSRFGMELVFYSITNKVLPENKEERESILREKIDELAFLCPRVPVRKGSGTFICVILNLENAMEEAAFIRDYKTLDQHTDLIFVTSELEIVTGNLERIPYDGNSIDTIFLPLIRWQRSQQ